MPFTSYSAISLARAAIYSSQLHNTRVPKVKHAPFLLTPDRNVSSAGTKLSNVASIDLLPVQSLSSHIHMTSLSTSAANTSQHPCQLRSTLVIIQMQTHTCSNGWPKQITSDTGGVLLSQIAAKNGPAASLKNAGWCLSLPGSLSSWRPKLDERCTRKESNRPMEGSAASLTANAACCQAC